MEEMIITLAKNNEIDKMTQARVEYCLRDNPNINRNDYEEFYSHVKIWVKENVDQNKFVTYFGQINEEIVCFAGVLMFTLPPILGNIKRKQGYILSFFTYQKYRKMGYGKQLMEYIKEDAKNFGIEDLVLKATKDGENLYRKCGFKEPNMPYMEKRIV